jgi:hypothetical protein
MVDEQLTLIVHLPVQSRVSPRGVDTFGVII